MSLLNRKAHIQWNKVTWYSRLVAIVVFVGIIPTLTFIIGMQYGQLQMYETLYLGHEMFNTPIHRSVRHQGSLGEYGYRCSDGSEFTMSPSSDMSTITIIPATSAERFTKTILNKIETPSGALYIGEGITFSAKGETLTLSSKTFKTMCNPMQNPDFAPFNFGD